MPPAMTTVNAADLLRIRGERNRLLGHHLFLPSAWDILLFLQTIDIARPIDVICRSLAMHPTNADRWLGVLLDEGLVEASHGSDGQLAFRLTRRARNNLEAAFSAASH